MTDPSNEAGPSSHKPPTTSLDLSSITSALDDLTSHAASIPPKSDLSFHRTLDRKFAKDLDGASSKVLDLSDRLLSLVHEAQAGTSGSVKGKGGVTGKGKGRRSLNDEEDVLEGFKRSVTEVIDGLLEDADSQLDQLSQKRPVTQLKVNPAIDPAKKLPGPFTPPPALSRSARKKLLPEHIIRANISKPQLLFPDEVDNSPSRPWKPYLAEKQHSMVPLGYDPLAPPEAASSSSSSPMTKTNSGSKLPALKYRQMKHPYWYETQHIQYPTRMFQISPPIPPRPLEETEAIYVDTVQELKKMVDDLKKASEIAIDLEHHSERSYYGFTCLIQISTREKDWIVDTIKLRGELREGKLGGVLADPEIVKVFHGADSDMVWLQRDFDIYVVNMFDTYHATHVLDFASHSLASLLVRYCDFAASKQYQMADWRIRPLPQELIDYARSDTHFLLYIYDRMRNALLEKSSRPSTPVPVDTSESSSLPVSRPQSPRPNPQRAMRRTLELSAETALKLYEREEYDAEKGGGMGGWKPMIRKWFGKNASEVPSLEVEVFKGIHAWRDKTAREMDESPVWVLAADRMKTLSMLRIVTIEAIDRILNSKKMAAQGKASEIMVVIEQSKLKFEIDQKIAREQKKAKSMSPSPKDEAKTIRPKKTAVTEDDVDIWADINLPTPIQPVSPNQKPSSSSLFGNTLSSQSRPRTPESSAPPAKKSNLFGSTLPSESKKPLSSTFDDIQKSIVESINPVSLTALDLAAPDQMDVDPATDASGDHEAHNTLPVEEVPYIPKNQRSTISNLKAIAAKGRSKANFNSNDQQPPSETSTTLMSNGSKSDDPTPAWTEQREVNKNDIVQVKRKKVKPNPSISKIVDGEMEEGNSSDGSSANGSGVGLSKNARRKAKKLALQNGSGILTPSFSLASSTISKPQPDEPTFTSEDVSVNRKDIGGVMAEQPTKRRKKEKKEKKDKSNVEIPEFDHSKEGSLLDGSQGVDTKEMSKKEKKKEKRKKAQNGPPPTMIETPNFGRAPRDLTQPKGGAKYQTFAS